MTSLLSIFLNFNKLAKFIKTSIAYNKFISAQHKHTSDAFFILRIDIFCQQIYCY